jgi:hypothetical protein
MTPPKESWDLERVYDDEIAPLMTRIIAVCKEHRMPMIASFAYKNTDEGIDFCSTSLPFENRNVSALNQALSVIRSRCALSLMAMTICSPEDEVPRG